MSAHRDLGTSVEEDPYKAGKDPDIEIGKGAGVPGKFSVLDERTVVSRPKSRYNEPMIRPHTDGLTYMEQPAPLVPGEDAIEAKTLTAGYCCIDALLAAYPDKKNDQKAATVSGAERLSRFELAEKIKESMYHDTDVSLTGGEQQRLMKLMEDKWSTDIYGQCHKIVYRNEPDDANGDSK